MLRRFALTVVLPAVVLLGFGLRALDQDRREADRQAQDRLQTAAGLAARAVDQQLANWQQFRSDGISLQTEPSLRIAPSNSSAYVPSGELLEGPAVEAELAEAEKYEQVQGNIASAIPLYLRATTLGKPHLRAVAFERLAACYRKTGRRDQAVQAYRELLRLPEQRIGPVSAELIARFELGSLGVGDRAAFYRDLVAGRWELAKPRYLFYSETARGWVGESDPVRAEERERMARAEAIEGYLDHPRRFLGGYVAFWRGSDALILPAGLLRQRLEANAALDRDVRISLVDASASRPASAMHALTDRELPWVVEAVPANPALLYAGADRRRTIYLAMLLLVFALLIVGSYVTAKTVKRELEVARLKSDFVATVSHEFRTPLTAIKQLSELLQRGRVPTEEKRQEYYGLISRESGRLTRLVGNLLDFSRMEDGRKQYHFERLETAAWLRDIAGGGERANVTLSIPPELPPITGDRMALTSAVDNLLDNAVKYSPPGAPVLCEVEAGDRELTIRVRDRGYGIAAEDRDHVFEKFYRGRGEVSRQVKGAGVGLSLVRQIVEAHGGAVDFESRVGEGTVFRIRLKLA